MSLKVGDKAPEFSLPKDGGGKIALKDLKGKAVVLYFYPKDDTSGCTAEACAFRDAQPDFSKVKAAIVGISRDSVQSHDKFKAKHELPFTLASDEDGIHSGPLSRHMPDLESAHALAERHETFFWVIVALIALHVLAVLYYLLVRRDDLVTPMVTGRGQANGSGEALVPAPVWRFLLAAALAAGLTLTTTLFL